jgi:hypothetical protein
LTPVNNVFAWLSGVLKNAHLGGEPEAHTSSQPEVKEQILTQTPKTVPARSNASKILVEINQLPAIERQKWVALAVAELKASKIFTAQDKKRSEEEKIVIGAFGGKVINLYATQVYGATWQTVVIPDPVGMNLTTEIIDV